MKLSITFFFLLASFCCLAQSAADEEAIKKVISESYVDGIQNGGPTDLIRKGFHPTFTMLRQIDNDIKPYPIEEWIAAIEKRKKEGTAQSPSPATGKFISVDITGTAAVVKLELYRDGKKTFTDYLVLGKFAEGWKIISKSFYRHTN